MANSRTITAANSVILLGVAGLFPVPVKIQGFSADDVTDTDSVETLESMMGVDGRLSGGFVYVPIRQNITLQADSPSNDFFEQWAEAERTIAEKYIATGSLVLPATGRKYAMTRGFLRGSVVLPAVKKTLQPRRFTIEWERVSPANA